jgi:hypothetical protein
MPPMCVSNGILFMLPLVVGGHLCTHRHVVMGVPVSKGVS